jgi:hypothetical protein
MGITMIDISCGFKQVRLPEDFGQTYLKRCKSEKVMSFVFHLYSLGRSRIRQ